jgi:phenolic acid decarboxylase
MRRILAFVLISFLSITIVAAQNSQTFYLASATRAGSSQLSRGIYEVSWGSPSKSRVTLTIKAEGDKTFKVFARVVEGKQGRTGVVTSVVDGVQYLRELDTSNAKFILENTKEEPK